MSQPDLESVSPPSVLAKKPQLNVYTVMLIVALLSLMLACLFLWLEISEYGGWGSYNGRITS
ncbi:MAG: hypothetical protein IH898_14130, partial [Planctomycetes bacterium]|nr:hypothetical protein [Planctomycetota bacterium]